nr:unnamed protein product [Spirometra erinaceieuropaei]
MKWISSTERLVRATERPSSKACRPTREIPSTVIERCKDENNAFDWTVIFGVHSCERGKSCSRKLAPKWLKTEITVIGLMTIGRKPPRTDYLQKAKNLLEDRQFYVLCERNPVKMLTRKINATLVALENSSAITPTNRRKARARETALTRFYGLPKVYKEGVPLRPIVSLKGTPTYGLAKWLFRRLEFLTADSDTTVSSSTQFLEKLKGDLAIETIEIILRSKYNETENRHGHALVLQLQKFCLRRYFTFDGTIYEQVEGTPMGSAISGFIAEAVLQRLESLVFQHRRSKFRARYVDNIFVVVIERDQVLTFKEHFNSVFLDIKFTMEEEEKNQLAFLDVLVCCKDCDGLKTNVFTKSDEHDVNTELQQ